MTAPPPTLGDWQGTNATEICTVASLQGYIRHRYSQVYWIAKLVDNVVTESHPLINWHFTEDGKLIGTVDTGTWQVNVLLHLDEYVVLSEGDHEQTPEP